MKRTLYLWISLFAFSNPLWAYALPETIEPKTKVIQTMEWYRQQAARWKEEINQNPYNAQSWLNYYLAAQYANETTTEIKNSIAPMAKTCPQSFEYQYINYRQTHNIAFLEKAYAMQPENPLTYSDFIWQYEQTGNGTEKAKFCKQWLQSRDLSTGLLSYCYNLLMSVNTNGVLLTLGENTTGPLWMVQQAMHIRPDVTILDLDLLTQTPYRQRVLSENKLIWQESAFQNLSPLQLKEAVGLHLSQHNPDRKVYYSASLPWSILNPVQENLYVVGLASQLSATRINNIEQLKEKLENQFLLDYLKVDFNGEKPQSTARVLATHYLAPMLLLQSYYRQNGDKDKASKWQQMALTIAQDQAQASEVQSYLEQNKIVSPSVAKPPLLVVSAEQLEKSFKTVFGKLKAQQTEVTNGSYQQFLDYLLQTKQTDKYEICKPDLSSYEGVGASFMQSYHTPYRISGRKVSETEKERSFVNHPVLNISFEAANLYCDWLTEQYNNQPARLYPKVKFRLPTLNEWRIAAIGANTLEASQPVFENLKLSYKPRKEKEMKTIDVGEVRYPWWRVFPQLPYNQFGCYLGNFKVDSSRCKTLFGDGFGFTGPVSSYFANDLGLYDVVGNVAEMISEKGKACGGSWNHLPEESTLRSITTYDKPDSRVGFRVFMEIVEDKK